MRKIIPPDELDLVSLPDQEWLADVFGRFGGYPNLEQIWTLMDEPWIELQCDPNVIDERIGTYYSHPIWLLNGLFIEQHPQSMENRECFKDWVIRQTPNRVAEFGGGFGSLARIIGQALPSADIEIIEPHPHPVAISRADKTTNVRYCAELSGEYNIIIATDVFEHVANPLQMVAETAQYLHQGGYYLTANCFAPVILCHLPQTFHFRYSWDVALEALGLTQSESVAYGRAFIRSGVLNLDAALRVERRSRALWRLTQHLPERFARLFTKNLFMFS